MGIKETTAKDKKISSSMAIGEQLWHLLRALFYKNHLFHHLNLRRLLRRTKIALHDRLHSQSCRSADPTRAYYSPKEIEFSCSNTPMINYNIFTHPHNHNKRKKTCKRRVLEEEAVARAFQILNSHMEMEKEMAPQVDDNKFVGAATPSPVALCRQYISSPEVVRQLRVTDSPFPVREEEVGGERQVDREAEEFIKRFHHQLRSQLPTL